MTARRDLGNALKVNQRHRTEILGGHDGRVACLGPRRRDAISDTKSANFDSMPGASSINTYHISENVLRNVCESARTTARVYSRLPEECVLRACLSRLGFKRRDAQMNKVTQEESGTYATPLWDHF